MIHAHRTAPLVAAIDVGTHHFLSGLDAKLGGKDEGPDPHELLEASLAACTILTAELYAKRKGIALTRTDVDVTILVEGTESRIERNVSFRGDLNAEERARLYEIVEKCPIHRLLESKITISTSVTHPEDSQ